MAKVLALTQGVLVDAVPLVRRLGFLGSAATVPDEQQLIRAIFGRMAGLAAKWQNILGFFPVTAELQSKQGDHFPTL